jgi:hypothetical protein
MSEKQTGIFYMYRGNGYGPFENLKLAKENATHRMAQPRNEFFLAEPCYFKGTVEVKEKRLVSANLIPLFTCFSPFQNFN